MVGVPYPRSAWISHAWVCQGSTWIAENYFGSRMTVVWFNGTDSTV